MIGGSDTPAELGRIVLGLGKLDVAGATRWLRLVRRRFACRSHCRAGRKAYAAEVARAGSPPKESLELVAALLVAKKGSEAGDSDPPALRDRR